MSNISIDNILNNLNVINKSHSRPLSVDDMCKTSIHKKLTTDQLLRVQKNRQRKVDDHYRRVYNMCTNRIKTANNMKITDILYDVPTARFMCPDYESTTCLDKIKEQLDEIFMDTLIINTNTIFISWKNIEQNREDYGNIKNETH